MGLLLCEGTAVWGHVVLTLLLLVRLKAQASRGSAHLAEKLMLLPVAVVAVPTAAALVAGVGASPVRQSKGRLLEPGRTEVMTAISMVTYHRSMAMGKTYTLGVQTRRACCQLGVCLCIFVVRCAITWHVLISPQLPRSQCPAVSAEHGF